MLARLAGLAVSVCVLSAAGCRGRAQDDLYRAKLTQQIRVLEDQLYDADYQNRVLTEELARARRELAEETPPQTEFQPAPTPDVEITPGTEDSYKILDPESLDAPSNPKPDTGTPQQPADQPPETATPDGQAGDDDASTPLRDPEKPAADPGLGEPTESVPAPVPEPSNSEPSNSEPGMLLPPPPKPTEPEQIPPGKPQPPSEEQLRDDPVIPGEVLPPDEAPDAPPGKIEISPDAKTLRFEPEPPRSPPVPDHLELHDGLSGGYRLDESSDADGLLLVVTAVDERDEPMPLEHFDIDAQLTVVVMEPGTTDPAEALGRWEFSPDEVRQLVRKAPVDGFHIPIEWQQRTPEGDEVIVHVRLAAAEDEMRCQGRVRLETSVAMSNWLPRG